VDRCPLDPLTFGKRSERRAKAKGLLKKITDGKAPPIEKGHLIYLDSDVSDIQQRNSYKHKYWKEEDIERLIGNITEIYGDVPKTRICTRGRSSSQVSREIARVIFVDPYNDISIQDRLEEHSEGSKS
jgi:hypothetical protein